MKNYDNTQDTIEDLRKNFLRLNIGLPPSQTPKFKKCVYLQEIIKNLRLLAKII
jgi:hypothetical protein